MKATLITFEIKDAKPTLVSKWLVDRDMLEDITYDWVKSEITFYNEEDAVAFSLAFKLDRKLSKVEQILANLVPHP